MSTALPKKVEAVEIRKIDSPEKRIETDGKPETKSPKVSSLSPEVFRSNTGSI